MNGSVHSVAGTFRDWSKTCESYRLNIPVTNRSKMFWCKSLQEKMMLQWHFGLTQFGEHWWGEKLLCGKLENNFEIVVTFVQNSLKKSSNKVMLIFLFSNKWQMLIISPCVKFVLLISICTGTSVFLLGVAWTGSQASKPCGSLGQIWMEFMQSKPGKFFLFFSFVKKCLYSSSVHTTHHAEIISPFCLTQHSLAYKHWLTSV